MSNSFLPYHVRTYQPGDEQGEARIGIQVALNWLWPFAYDKDDLRKMAAQPGFDPHMRFYCFQGDLMIGYMSSRIQEPGADGHVHAAIEFPRMLPGHEPAAELLLGKAINNLSQRGVSRLSGRVNSMAPGDIPLAEKAGFQVMDWGYKVYYAREMALGRLDLPADDSRAAPVEEIDPSTDLPECAVLAAKWYGRTEKECLDLLGEWHSYNETTYRVITHPGIRRKGRLVAACMAAPNALRRTTAANYYITTPDEACLASLLARVVDRCIEWGTSLLVCDLVNEHRRFEPAYQGLGFHKAAEWGRVEKIL